MDYINLSEKFIYSTLMGKNFFPLWFKRKHSIQIFKIQTSKPFLERKCQKLFHSFGTEYRHGHREQFRGQTFLSNHHLSKKHIKRLNPVDSFVCLFISVLALSEPRIAL